MSVLGVVVKTLIIDNYDSFTYNLAHLLAQVNQEAPVVVRNDEASWEELASLGFDNVVISPGPGRPDRAGDFGVSRQAILAAAVPVLGVCLGHQGIAALHGGTVERAPVPMHGRSSLIRHDGDALFAGIPSPFRAVRYHSLVVARPLRAPLVETASTGDGLIMALRHRERPLWGVQFHPESIATEHGLRLIANFRDLSRRHRPRGRVVRAVADPLPHGGRKATAAAAAGVARVHEIPRAVDAEAAFLALHGASTTAFWLDSSLAGSGQGRWSYFGEGTRLLSYDVAARRLEVVGPDGRAARDQSIFDHLDRARRGAPSGDLPCPFVGGHVGWFGYELRHECGAPSARRAATPDALFLRAERFVAVDHHADRSYVVALDGGARSSAAEDWAAATAAALAQLGPAPPPHLGGHAGPIAFRLDRDRAAHLADVARCLDWIGEGETYQVCLTNEIRCALGIDPLDLYRVLRRLNPAPYAAFLRWAGGAVLSASPERFLAVTADGRVQAKPIKGTIARAADPARDRQLARRLQASEKDRAENLMIVDLLRNDLSRVCEPGSVVVPKLMAVESYATVHQLVSTVEGVLKPGASAIDLVRAAFPGGSMTGAPKRRTLDLIDRLEGRARGVYSGALGWLGDDGAADLSIVIRTIVAADGMLAIGVGGGVVAQSTPEGEFEEMLLKAEASIRSIVTAATGRYEPGLYRLDGAGADEAERLRLRAGSA